MGSVKVEREEDDPEEWATEEVREVLGAYVFVERYSLEAWNAVHGVMSEWGIWAIGLVGAELDRCEFEARVEEAERTRSRACRKKR